MEDMIWEHRLTREQLLCKRQKLKFGFDFNFLHIDLTL